MGDPRHRYGSTVGNMKPEYREHELAGISTMPVETLASLIVSPPVSVDRTWTIGELARECDVTLRALRFYEGKGLITPTRAGGARLYGREEVRRLRLVLRLKDLGFSLAEIAGLVDRLLGSGDVAERLSALLGRVESQVEVLDEQRRQASRALGVIEHEIAELRRRLGR
mgnify:CR=1 FL=1